MAALRIVVNGGAPLMIDLGSAACAVACIHGQNIPQLRVHDEPDDGPNLLSLFVTGLATGPRTPVTWLEPVPLKPGDMVQLQFVSSAL